MITGECKHQRNYLHEHFNSIKQNKQMQTWSDETWFYIKALWKDDVHNLTIYRFMHCYRNVTCSEVIGELQPHQHRTWSSHQGSADSPALICVQSSCAGHEASQWFESTEGRYMASLLVRILSCGSCCGWRGHCVTCTVCHTQSICSVESWVLRWLHSPILELHTFSQCGQNTFGEDFVLWVLLWLKRPMRDRHHLPHTLRMCSVESWILRWLHSPILELHTFSQCGQNTFGEDFVLWVLLWMERPMRDRHCLPHTEHLLCRVMSYQMKLQSNLGVAYLLTVWTEHFWWGLCLVGLAVAEEANAWQALFVTNQACKL